MADQPCDPFVASGGVSDDVAELIIRYFDHALDEAGLAELRVALIHSEQTRALFVRWGLHGELLSESLSANYQEQDDGMLQGSPKVLAELVELERQAQASLVEMHNLRQPWHRSPWLIGAGSLASVLTIAVVLVIAYSGPGGSRPIADDSSETGGIVPDDYPVLNPIVATLTAERDAIWSIDSAEGALAPGSPMRAGQRLTLTQGFAEITTNRGAVVIIEAPATIELIDHTNALELHSGKLVGICETDSSKGLLIRTPHMEITDVGTRFGVYAAGPGSTEVYIFEGEIEVLPNGLDRQPMVYTTGQAVSITSEGESRPMPKPVAFTVQLPKDDALASSPLGPVAYFPLGDRLVNRIQLVESSRWGAAPEGDAEEGVFIRPGEEQVLRDSAYTIALWLKPGQADTDRHVLSLTTPEGLAETFSNQLSITADGRVRHYVYSIDDADQRELPLLGGEGLMQYSQAKLQPDAWTYVVATCSANGQMKLYLNGQRDARLVSVPAGLMFGSHYVLAGPAQTRTDGPEIARLDLAPYADGLNSLALFDRQLMDKEVKELYSAAKAAQQQVIMVGGDN